jgi:DNA-binding MarR family transcriptional regulator
MDSNDDRPMPRSVTRDDCAARPDPSTWQQHELLSYKLAILARLLERGSESRLARKFGLWLTDCRVLGHLVAKSPRTVRDLAEDMVMDKAPISRSASRLVEKGLLTREADPLDGRSAVFQLTPEGRKIAGSIVKNAQDGQAKYLERLDPEQCWQLLESIDKLLRYAKTELPVEGGR